MTQGWASIPRWLLYSQEVTPKAKLVYLVIQSHTNEQGTAWPSQATIATESGLSLATVKRGLEELRKRGLVTAQERRRKDGGQTSSLYAVAMVAPPVDNGVDNQPPSSQ